jgi:capsular exopolysaccharide synthesis family protein
VNTIAVVDPATLPSSPSRPNVALNAALASGLGLLVGLAFVLVGAYTDDTVYNPEQLGEALGLPTLAVVGEFPKAARWRLGPSGAADQPPASGQISHQTPRTDAYHVLRSNLRSLGGRDSGQVVLITSAGAGEGKTTTATNLSIALALAGYNTLLVDADLQRPVLHSQVGLDNTRGLSTLLSDGATVGSCQQPTHLPKLSVLTSGPVPPNASALLASRALAGRFTELSQSVDYVIVDSPPVLLAPDVLTLVPHVTSVVLVVRARVTRASAVLRAWEALERLGAARGGLVLNRFRGKLDTYYAGYAPTQRNALQAPGARFDG